MLKKIIFLLLIGVITTNFSGYSSVEDIPRIKRSNFNRKSHFFINKRTETHNKWVAAGLDISLGLFGVHRLYLGTEAQVPVMYTLTLGGGGILIIADLVLILTTKDLENYSNKSHIFMWND